MIKVILTKAGWEAQKHHLSFKNDKVWVNSGILAEAEIRHLRSDGLDLTNWNHHIGDDRSLTSALETVREHHPDEEIWFENVGNSQPPGKPF